MSDLQMLKALKKLKQEIIHMTKTGENNGFEVLTWNVPELMHLVKKNPHIVNTPFLSRMHMITGSHWYSIIDCHFPKNKTVKHYLHSNKMSLPIAELFDMSVRISGKPLTYSDILTRINKTLHQLENIFYPKNNELIHKRLAKLINMK